LWKFSCGEVQIEKRIWLEPYENTSYIQYTLERAPSPVKLSLKSLVNYRSYHGGILPKLKYQNLIDRGIEVIMEGENSLPFLSI